MDNDTVVAVISLAAFWCIGGLHGLTVAWTQPARMAHWATLVERAYYKLHGDDHTFCGALCTERRPCERPNCEHDPHPAVLSVVEDETGGAAA